MGALLKKNNYRKKSKTKLVNLFNYNTYNIIIVGGVDISKEMKGFEEYFNFRLVYSNLGGLKKKVNSRTLAIIIDERKITTNELAILKGINLIFKKTPTFYLTSRNRKESHYNLIYAKGVSGIIRWPQESKFLLELIVEALRPHPRATAENTGDQNMASMVKSYLEICKFPKNISIRAVDGFVFLKGRCGSLAQREQIIQSCLGMPGVKSVVSTSLNVRPSKENDKELELRLKKYLRLFFKKSYPKVGLRVKNKVVILTCLAFEDSNLAEMESFIQKQEGVEAITRIIKLNQSMSRNSAKVRHVQRKITDIFESSKRIKVELFKDVAEVTGHAISSYQRRIIGDYILQHLPVVKVVNKITVP